MKQIDKSENVHNQTAKIVYDLAEHSSTCYDPGSQELEAGGLCACDPPVVHSEEMSQAITSLPYNLINKSGN